MVKKKTDTGSYLEPQMEVLEIGMSKLICLSGGIDDLNPYDPWAEGE